MSWEDCVAPEAPAPSSPAGSARPLVGLFSRCEHTDPHPVGAGCCLVVSLLTEA